MSPRRTVNLASHIRIAARMLMELEDEAFAGSQDKPARMADEAIAEIKAGKTIPLEDIL